MQFRAIVLDVKVKNNEWPLRSLVLAQRPLDNGPDPFEKVSLQRRLASSVFGSVRNHQAPVSAGIDEPSQILLDSNRVTRLKCAIYAILPLSFVGIAIVPV